MYYSWGLTLSLQIVSLTPIMKTYLPSCLTYFLKDFCISLLHHSWIRDFFYSQSWLKWLTSRLTPTYNPLSYRLKRHDFIYTSVIINMIEMLCVWLCSFGLIFFFLLLRLIFSPLHFWGEHFADLERSFRY